MDRTKTQGLSRDVIVGLLGDRWGRVSMLAASSTLSGIAEALILAIVAQVAAGLTLGSHALHTSVGPFTLHASIPVLLGAGFGFAVLRLVLQVPTAYLPARIVSDVHADFRKRLFDSFTRASWSEQASDREGYLQELMTSQVFQASQGAVQATNLIASLFAFGVLLAAALVMNPAAAGVLLVVSLALFAGLRPLSVAGTRFSRSFSEAQMLHAAGVSEATRLAEETHVFGVEAPQRSRIEGLIERSRGFYFRTQVVVRFIPSIYQSCIYLLLVGGLALVYWFDTGNVASLGGVVLLLVRAGAYGNQVQSSYQSIKQSLPFIEQLQGAEAHYRASARVDGTSQLRSVENIRLESVEFEYVAGRPVLSDISFQVEAGEAIGIIGPSGAGKSTLSQILLQLRAPTKGRYLINGRRAEAYRNVDWTRLVAYVPQTPHLLHASVADNVRYFRDISPQDVENAARAARIQEDVLGWRDGYETMVGPRADAVSGGQAQRICLARALAGHPEVLLLDEPTSALDPHSERAIQESLEALKGAVTLFIIAHRMSTLDLCDRVMVIVDGRLQDFGSIGFLQEHNAYYSAAASDAIADPQKHDWLPDGKQEATREPAT